MKNIFDSILVNVTDKHFVMLAASLAGLKAVFEQYVFSDWQFGVFLAIIVIIDTVLGTYRAWKDNELDSKAYSRLFEKIFLYMCLLIMVKALMSFTVSGVVNGFFGWLDSAIYSGIMVREAISVIENMGQIKPDIFPTWLLKRFKKFDETGQVKDLLSE